MENKNYIKIEFPIGYSIEQAVKKLLEYREKGILAYGEFYGINLYSDTITINRAYKQITGKTKLDFDEEKRRLKEEFDKREKEQKENILELTEEWINKGKEILDEDKWEYWERIVPKILNDLYHGKELGCCLEIVEVLNNKGTLEEAKELIEKQSHSGMYFNLVCSMVKVFCDRGIEFADYVNNWKNE